MVAKVRSPPQPSHFKLEQIVAPLKGPSRPKLFLQEIEDQRVNEADLLYHAARCRRLALALSDEAGRRVLFDLAAECHVIAERSGQDRGVRHHSDRFRAARRVLDPLPLF